jgi:hypothetical protein
LMIGSMITSNSSAGAGGAAASGPKPNATPHRHRYPGRPHGDDGGPSHHVLDDSPANHRRRATAMGLRAVGPAVGEGRLDR